ncbi:MAG: glycosyltransferase [Fluviicola sp.]|nr:glycosyltransferase [Fluviicola sp.]MBP6272045.1 glycosyltransferase [Fluviicola sp.]
MKILQVGPNSVHVTRFINAFDSNESISNFLLSDSPNLEAKVTQQFVVNAHTFNPIKIIGILKIIQTIVQQVKPTVIHIHQVNRLAFFTALVAKWRKIPVVTTAWGSDVLIMPSKNKLYHYLVKKTLQRSAVISADAQEMIRAMQLLVPTGQFVCIQYGITPVESTNKKEIIYSNRLHKPLYNIDKIISLFADFHTQHPSWHLIIGGSGSETEKLKNQTKQLGLTENVQFIGWLNEDDNRAQYAKATIYVSIPSSDGTSVSLLEAMSANCIPVVSDLPSNKEWISDNTNGIIFQEEGENPFKQALLLNQQIAFATNQQLINQKATRNASIAQFLSIYKTLVNGE